jgi:hypothetical protein
LFSDPNGLYPYVNPSTSLIAVNYRITQSITDANGTPTSNVIDKVVYIGSGQSGNTIGRIITYRCNTTNTSPTIGGPSQEPAGGVSPYCMSNPVALTAGGYVIITND